MIRRHRGRAPDAGVTLVELLLVVLILGLIGSMSALSAPATATHHLELVETQVRDAVDQARALARSQRLAHGVVFDTVAERFAVVDESGTPAVHPLTKGPYEVTFGGPGQLSGIDVASVDFGSAGTAALFDGQGDPLVGGTIVLRKQGAAITLALDAATGELQAQ